MSSQASRAARTVRCQSCRGSIPVQSLSPVVTCPYCQSSQALDGQVLREFAEYRAQTEAHIENARHELAQAQAWQHMTGRPGTSATLSIIVGIGLMMGLPIVVAMTGAFLIESGVLPMEWAPFISFAAIGAFMISFIAYMVWYYGGKRGQATISMGAVTQVTCPNCGAVSSFGMGQIVETCTHCGGAMLPTATVMHAGVAAAHQVARAAQMERFRTERAGMAMYSGYNMASFVPYYVSGSFALVIVMPTILFSVAMVRGEEPFNPLIFLLWLLSFCVIGAPIGIALHRRSQRQRLEAASTSLAAQLGGRFAWGVQPIVEWMNGFWAGPYSTQHLMSGRLAIGVFAAASRFPLLIFFDPIRASEHCPAKVEVLLAAWIPGLSDGTGQPLAHTSETTRLVQWLTESGFVVEYNQAGLRLIADEMIVKAVRKNPEENLVKLPEVVTVLLRLASGLGAAPVARIP